MAVLESPEILVPVDFSPCSVNALRVAIAMASPDGDITLLHVVDENFIKDAVSVSLGTADEIRSKLRDQAELLSRRPLPHRQRKQDTRDP